MATISEALALALQHHQAGRLDLAEDLYRRILAIEPNHADALHFLGIAAHQAGRHEEAVDSIERAIRVQGTNSAFHNNLGEAYRALKQFSQAIACYRRALELKPDSAQVMNNLGIALKEQGKLDEAIACYRRALQLQPDYAEAHNNLGTALQEQGNLADAIAAYRRALQLKPGYAEAHGNLGKAFHDQGMLDEAVTYYRRALELKGNYAEACNNLGNALRELGRLDEAISCCRQALQLKPDYAKAHNNLGNALLEQGRVAEAMESYRRALELQPRSAETHYNMGNAWRDQGLPDEAVASLRRALEIKPGFAEAYSNMGNALKDQGKVDEALASYRQALRLKPDFVRAHSNLIYSMSYSPACSAADLRAEMRDWDQRHAARLTRDAAPHANQRSPERRLRIGYVSECFRDHCLAFYMTPLFAAHDHEQFEIVCYSDVARPDRVTHRLRASVDLWRDVAEFNDERLARLIRDDEIDVLSDLNMHMAHSRLLMFARRPAPVQVCWMAYPGSTGMTAMDYRLTDPYLDPPGVGDESYAEQSVRLPDSFWCYDPLTAGPPVSELPALKRGHVTFGSLNNFCKVNDGVLRLWARVLMAVPGSRLVLLAPQGSSRARTLQVLEQEGVARERVQFEASRPRAQYLELFQGIDIGLDTFPYNGHTTSLDSYWMGVPVVTLVGATVVGRAGVSQLTNLGLTELIGETPDAFVRIAVSLTQDLPRLRDLRTGLRARMQQSPLMDGPRFTRHLEAAYRDMWRRWCEGTSNEP